MLQFCLKKKKEIKKQLPTHHKKIILIFYNYNISVLGEGETKEKKIAAVVEKKHDISFDFSCSSIEVQYGP